MVQRVAITGATGFAGSHVVPLLQAQGFSLRILARSAGQAPADSEIVVGDLSNLDALAQLCADAHAVVHLAGAISAPDRKQFFAINEQGTRNLATSAARAGVKRFIHISSLSAREPQLSSYAASKRAGEEAIAQFASRFSLAVLRPPAVYGPGDKATLPLLRQLTQRFALIPGRRDTRVSLIHATDLARFVAGLLSSDWQGMAEIDDGANNGYAWTDLAQIAAETQTRSITPIFLPRGLVATLARLAPATGLTVEKVRELYHPDWLVRGQQPPLDHRTDFRRGFVQTIAWYRAQGWLPPAVGAHKTQPQDRGETA